MESITDFIFLGSKITVSTLIYYVHTYIMRERERMYILMHLYGIQKDGTDDPTCRAAKEAHT